MAVLLRTGAITEALAAAMVDGVETVMCARPSRVQSPVGLTCRSASTRLVDRDGSVVATSAGTSDEKMVRIAAIAANTWQCHGAAASTVREIGPLRVVLFAMEKQGIAIVGCSEYLVTCTAGSGVPLGMLKLKASALAKALTPILAQLTTS